MAKHRRRRQNTPSNWAVPARTVAAVVGSFVSLVRLIQDMWPAGRRVALNLPYASNLTTVNCQGRQQFRPVTCCYVRFY